MKLPREPFTITFWRKHDNPKRLLEDVRQKYKTNPAFARLLHGAARATLHGRAIKIEGKNNARRILRHAIDKLYNEEVATVQHEEGKPPTIGKWQWLALDEHPYTQNRVWQKVSRAQAWVRAHEQGQHDTFSLRCLLGYRADTTREQARRIERAHYPKFIRITDPEHPPMDTSYDLEPQENEHFRNDRGFYDDRGTLTPYQPQPSRSWESAYATREEAWNGVHIEDARQKFGGRAYPGRLWSLECNRKDLHGVARWYEIRDHQQACERALMDLERRQQLVPRKDAPWWDMKDKDRQALQQRWRARRATLDRDDAEVAAHAHKDVPESDLRLLEAQVKACSGNAPRGVIGALAQARLEARTREEAIRRQQEGLQVLEDAACAA